MSSTLGDEKSEKGGALLSRVEACTLPTGPTIPGVSRDSCGQSPKKHEAKQSLRKQCKLWREDGQAVSWLEYGKPKAEDCRTLNGHAQIFKSLLHKCGSMNLLRDLLNAIAEPMNGPSDAAGAAGEDSTPPRRRRHRSRGSSSRRSPSATAGMSPTDGNSQSPPVSRQGSVRQDSNESPEEKKSFDM